MDERNLSILKAALNAQIQAIDQIIGKIHERKSHYAEDVHVTESLGYQLHNLYCAFEDLFEFVAKCFENNIEDTSRYHIELLKRMTLDIEGVRPPLISRELYVALDELRAFRHVFRHAYAYEIDPDKIALLLKKFDEIEANYKNDLQRFLTLLTDVSDLQT